MRSFEERIEQIQIRSEKLRAERKRKRRIAAACVPLVLCLGLYGIIALPHKQPPKTAGMGTPGGAVNDGALYSQGGCPVEKICVSGMGESRTLTKQSEILPVMAYLEPLVWQVTDFSTADSVTTRGENKDAAPESDDNESFLADAAELDCSITLILANGSREVFLFDGVQLENPRSGQTVILTRSQQRTLMTLLGLQ